VIQLFFVIICLFISAPAITSIGSDGFSKILDGKDLYLDHMKKCLINSMCC